MRFTAAIIAVLVFLAGCSQPTKTNTISGTLAFEPPPVVMQARSAFPNPPIVAGEVLIGFFGDTDDAFSPPTSIQAGGVTLHGSGQRNALGTYAYTSVSLSEQETWAIVNQLEQSGVYATVLPNILLETFGTPIAPANLWHYELANVMDAWDLGYTGAGVTVGIVDTGGTVPGGLEHPDVQFVGGYKFDGFPGADYTAVNHHGMHVAGTIGGNGPVFRGVAPDAGLVAARALGGSTGGMASVFDAIWWTAGGTLPNSSIPSNPNPAQIINISLGTTTPTACPAAIGSLFEMLRNAGIIVVVAAGNEGLPADQVMPANCPGVITVGALEPGGTQAPYSGYGPAVDIMAPGGLKDGLPTEKVFSTLIPELGDPATYGWEAGTSMAAPHVAGVIALILEKNPTLSANEVLSILQSTASEPASCNECGAGAVDAKAALAATPPSTGPRNFPVLPPRPNAYYPAFVVALKTCNIGKVGCIPISPHYTHGVSIDASRFTQVSQFSDQEPFEITGVEAGDYHVLAWRPFRTTGSKDSGVPLQAVAAAGDEMAISTHRISVSEHQPGHVNLVLAPYQYGSIDPMLVDAMTQVLSNGL